MELPLEEEKKKRGRKKKIDIQTNDTVVVEEDSLPKKRGRKPKGGKLVTKEDINQMDKQNITNIILHLKCSMNDLSLHNTDLSYHVHDPLIYNPNAPPTVSNYDLDRDNFALYNPVTTTTPPSQYVDMAQSDRLVNNNICGLCRNGMGDDNTRTNTSNSYDNDISMSDSENNDDDNNDDNYDKYNNKSKIDLKTNIIDLINNTEIKREEKVDKLLEKLKMEAKVL